MIEDPVLSIESMTKHFRQGGLFSLEADRVVRAVDGVTLSVREGEALGIVGESGCGKSTLARCLVGIHPPSQGQIRYKGSSLWTSRGYNAEARRDIQMVFQDQSCLNPRMTVEQSVSEPLLIHRFPKQEWKKRLSEVLELVQLSPSIGSKYPRQLSGGQAQRVIIARALVLRPRVLIADEPVSKLDVSVQAHILNSLKEIKDEYSLTLIYISHDLATVDYLCDRIAVMYLGRIVEVGASDVLYNPKHPYTQALLSAVPGQNLAKDRVLLSGVLPDPANIPAGCRFSTRCPYVAPSCIATEPDLLERERDHFVRCHFNEEELTLSPRAVAVD